LLLHAIFHGEQGLKIKPEGIQIHFKFKSIWLLQLTRRFA